MTIEIRRNALVHFEKWNSKELKDVTEADIQAFFETLDYSVNTLNSISDSLRQFFSFCEKEFIIFANPCLNLRSIKCRPLPKVLSVEQVSTLLKSIRPKRNKAIFELIYSTAIRRSELLGLTLDDVDLIKNTIHITGKGEVERVLPFGETARKCLIDYLENARPKTTIKQLFVNREGAELTKGALDKIVMHIVNVTGIQFSCHTLRRSCASHLLSNGASPLIIAKLLGHTDLKTLSHYLKISVSDIKEMHSQSQLGV